MIIKMDTNNKLILRFGIGTIEHLGIRMYKDLPSVLSELISNAYDADAELVEIHLNKNGNNQEIIIKDNGNGMSFEEINNKFLTIGRNKRLKNENSSPNKGRKVIGRKGIGKLAVFGIADIIHITSIKNNLKNEFILNLNDIKKLAFESKLDDLTTYEPKIISYNIFTDEENQTEIKLQQINRKTELKLDSLRYSIAKRFPINVDDFKIKFYENNKEIESVEEINSQTKIEIFKGQFYWKYPDEDNTDFSKRNNINGLIITSETPLKEEEKGIQLYARGKLVNKNEFYGVKITNSNAYNYMRGYFNVDFIDDFSKDLINTSRDSLLWEEEELTELRKWLQEQIKSTELKWREKRGKEGIKEATKNEDIKEWYEQLAGDRKEKAQQIFSKINQLSLPYEEKQELFFSGVLAFETLNFKDCLSELDKINVNNIEDFLKITAKLSDIEAGYYYKIVKERLSVIRKLVKSVNENALERKLQDLLAENLWLLDPSWDRAVENPNMEETIKTIINNENNNLTPEEKEARLDIRYKKTGNKHIIIELKRPKRNLNKFDLIKQVDKYDSALRKKIKFPESFEIVLLLGNPPSNIKINTEDYDKFITQIEASHTRVIYYNELINNAEKMYSEFLEKEKKANSFLEKFLKKTEF